MVCSGGTHIFAVALMPLHDHTPADTGGIYKIPSQTTIVGATRDCIIQRPIIICSSLYPRLIAKAIPV